jgi:hypothetical protein
MSGNYRICSLKGIPKIGGCPLFSLLTDSLGIAMNTSIWYNGCFCDYPLAVSDDGCAVIDRSI